MRGTGPLTWLSGTTGVPPEGTLVTRFWACVWTSSATVRARTVVETTKRFFDTALPRFFQINVSSVSRTTPLDDARDALSIVEGRSHGEHGVSKTFLRASVARDRQTRIR